MDLHAATELFQAAAAATTAGRLANLGLGRRFPALLAYLIFIAASDLLFCVVRQNSLLYYWMFIASTPLETIFNTFAVRELLTVTFESYPGIRTVGRWAMYAGIAVAAIISLATTSYLWGGGSKVILFYFGVAQRSIALTLAIVVVTIIFVLSKYPLHLARNIYISFGFFSALFLSDAVRLSIDSLAPALYNDYADWGEFILTALFLGGWAVLLQPQEAQVARVAFSTPEEENLLQQLNSLNQLMTRAGRQ